jgi:hypothetical protein
MGRGTLEEAIKLNVRFATAWPLVATLGQLEFLAGGQLLGVSGRVCNSECLPRSTVALLFMRLRDGNLGSCRWSRNRYCDVPGGQNIRPRNVRVRVLYYHVNFRGVCKPLAAPGCCNVRCGSVISALPLFISVAGGSRGRTDPGRSVADTNQGSTARVKASYHNSARGHALNAHLGTLMRSECHFLPKLTALSKREASIPFTIRL